VQLNQVIDHVTQTISIREVHFFGGGCLDDHGPLPGRRGSRSRQQATIHFLSRCVFCYHRRGSTAYCRLGGDEDSVPTPEGAGFR
jgi:hypothetical protein